MKEEDKYIIRKSLLELATKGVRSTSIDRELSAKNSHRISNISDNDIHNLWDSVTLLGAQLSRPAYDPYRETISLTTSIGRETTTSKKIILTMPIIIYGDGILNTAVDSFNVIHIALNRLMENNSMTIGLTISKDNDLKKLGDNRKYPIFQKLSNDIITNDNNKLEESLSCSEGIILECREDNSVDIFKDLRNKFAGPVIAEITNNNFSDDMIIPLLLDVGVDGIFVDTEEFTKSFGHGGKRHTMAIICELRHAIDSYYNKRRKNNDGVSLIVSGNINSSGNIAKAIALGADVIAYGTSLLIANAEVHDNYLLKKISLGSSDIDAIAEKICKHLKATRMEIKAITAAMGYSNLHNISSSDLRTSNIEASIQGDILIEGVEKSYIEILESLFDKYLQKEGIQIDDMQRQRIMLSLIGNRRILQ